MPKFTVDIPHKLDTEEARGRLQKAQAKLESEYGAKCSWSSPDVMQVTRKGLDANVKVEANRLAVDVTLGLLMTPMMGPIRDGITQRLTKLMQPEG